MKPVVNCGVYEDILLGVRIYVTKCRLFNEKNVNHKICQIAIRRSVILNCRGPRVLSTASPSRSSDSNWLRQRSLYIYIYIYIYHPAYADKSEGNIRIADVFEIGFSDAWTMLLCIFQHVEICIGALSMRPRIQSRKRRQSWCSPHSYRHMLGDIYIYIYIYINYADAVN